MNLIGWIGAIALALCAVPQAWQSFKEKNSDGINDWFLGLWILGEVASFIYVVPTGDMPLIANYGANLVLLGIIGYYKWRRG